MNNLFQISVFVFQSRNSQWCSLETLQKIGTLIEFLNVLVKILILMVFSWFLDLSIQSWITLVLTKYFSLACIFSLSMSLRMLKVLFGQKEVSFFALKYWLLSLPKKGTFCNKNLNLVVFGQRRSHQNYQGVLNTVFTQRWSLETNIYIIYTLYQPAFAELQNVKEKRWKDENGSK